MGIEKINKKEFLNSFLSDIFRFSDKEYQKRAWIEGTGPEYGDFDEAVMWFFEDGEIVMSHYKEFGITETQHVLLKIFWDEFTSFSDKHSWPPDFIDTPEWTKITEMAKEVLKAFHWKMPVQD